MADRSSGPDLTYIASLTRVRAAAGVILRNRQGQVLVVYPTYKAECELPGGSLEQDESPLEACQRELKEELGFVPPVGGLLCVDWVPPNPPWDGGLMFLFDGGVLSQSQIAEIRLPPDELGRFEFVSPDALESVLVPRLARRVLASLPSGGHGGVYLEDGVSVAR